MLQLHSTEMYDYLIPNRDVWFSYSCVKVQPERPLCSLVFVTSYLAIGRTCPVYGILPISSQETHLLHKPHFHVLGQSVHLNSSKVFLA